MKKIIVCLVCLLALVYGWLSHSTTQAQQTTMSPPLDGAKLYEQRCAVCHDNAQDRTPP
ncbi:MAG: hypothetical protein HOP19_03000, partial [Acidobacteria bacterium]|nr:hypothetical protein [Acidobacteriota bacterium]